MSEVRELHLGETTVYFYDDYCKETTPEEVNEILDHIAALAFPYFRTDGKNRGKTGKRKDSEESEG